MGPGKPATEFFELSDIHKRNGRRLTQLANGHTAVGECPPVCARVERRVRRLLHLRAIADRPEAARDLHHPGPVPNTAWPPPNDEPSRRCRLRPPRFALELHAHNR